MGFGPRWRNAAPWIENPRITPTPRTYDTTCRMKSFLPAVRRISMCLYLSGEELSSKMSLPLVKTVLQHPTGCLIEAFIGRRC